ncbi:MAG: dihydrolipoyl dehydrogenase [Bacteroidales bacterium]|nr:dihydrolipoyl dehydrogenase [Bacteroidales bacterium]
MYSLAIIGGGPAGYVAAEKAAKGGMSVVLFEMRELGGVCLNEGCIPTKTLLYSAKMLDQANHADRYGVNVADATLDFASVMKRKDKVVKKLVGGVKVRMRNAAVEVIREKACIEGAIDGGFSIKAGENTYEAEKILICTGSEASVPPIPGLADSDAVVTNREILSLAEVPSKLVVIGGGVIGMEFASFFNSIGTEVTVIEMLPKILGPMDDEISAMLQAQYAKKGVQFHLSCKVTAIEGNEVVYETPEGEICRAQGDKILLSVGRRANIRGFGLENIGVAMERGIKVNEKMETSVPGVYAAGDVTAFSMLAHTASHEAEVAVSNMLGIPATMSYNAIPGIVYTNPEVAGVGITEQEAGADVKVLKLPMAYSGRFVAENERGEGLCKVLVGPDDKVLGVHMLGNPCSEIILSAAMAISRGLSVKELLEVVYPHPTVSEILKETLSLG